ncbi:hypothetical protein JAAARDRAFT_511165 [Jaapia argillacea MUCL 33604]|uniref:Uncharacterized protein n=1 Tax=Jaapia argillacea MUCL 33604 TaxID=933084 RepID=A0A067Q349_9AGAM|nr:hypothetical protein JAAARDRAFT_511165 [Jaapia argillacea MUCL 33604]
MAMLFKNLSILRAKHKARSWRDNGEEEWSGDERVEAPSWMRAPPPGYDPTIPQHDLLPSISSSPRSMTSSLPIQYHTSHTHPNTYPNPYLSPSGYGPPLSSSSGYSPLSSPSTSPFANVAPLPVYSANPSPPTYSQDLPGFPSSWGSYASQSQPPQQGSGLQLFQHTPPQSSPLASPPVSYPTPTPFHTPTSNTAKQVKLTFINTRNHAVTLYWSHPVNQRLTSAVIVKGYGGKVVVQCGPGQVWVGRRGEFGEGQGWESGVGQMWVGGEGEGVGAWVAAEVDARVLL